MAPKDTPRFEMLCLESNIVKDEHKTNFKTNRRFEVSLSMGNLISDFKCMTFRKVFF